MKESLPSHVLKEKLPRFLQKCAQTFESDRRYRNDSRYIRVWVQLVMKSFEISRDTHFLFCCFHCVLAIFGAVS